MLALGIELLPLVKAISDDEAQASRNEGLVLKSYDRELKIVYCSLQFVDRYEDAVVGLLKKKQAGLPTPKEEPAAPAQNVVNLMDALRKSLAQDGKKVSKPKKRTEGQREMLLPNAGKGGKDKEKASAISSRLRKTG